MNTERDTSGADHAMSDAERTLRVLCHELSGLIDGAHRYVEMARRDCAQGHDPERIGSFLGTAGTALAEATELLRTVRLGRADERSPISRLATLRPVGESVDHAVDLARTLAMPRSIRVVSRVSAPFRDLGPAPIFPVVSNALRNALEMTPRDGTIELHARVDTDEQGQRVAAILVLDDGPGPSRDAQEHAFEIGFTTRPSGMGIGLALARSIIEDLGGRIELKPRVSVDGRRGGALIASWPVRAERSIGGPAGDAEGRAA